MQRLYVVVPTVELASRLVDELRAAGVKDWHIHLIAKDHVALEKAHLHEAGLLQRSEFIPAVERGAAAGGVTGLLAGIAAVTFPPAGLVLGGGAILGLGLLGAGLGAWIAGTMGPWMPAEERRELAAAVERGELLLLIDVEDERADAIAALLESHQAQWP